MNINEEFIVERFKKAAEVFAKALVKAFNGVLNFLKDKWEAVKEFARNYKPVYKKPIHPASKVRAMSRHTIRSQVMDRKPMFIRARTTC